MNAIVQTEYGGPEVLRLAQVERPQVSAGRVLVRVQAAAVHAGDWHLMRGKPWLVRLIFGGLWKPKVQILGCDVAGEVVAVGTGVTRFQPGDAVFADVSESGFGAFADYALVPEAALVRKPANVSFEAAAAVPVSAGSALQGLRDTGKLQAGQQVLIIGAGGGVGSFAVQIAKLLGAEVTAVCGANKLERVKLLQPHHLVNSSVIDVCQIDNQINSQSDGPRRYDLIFDTAAYRPAKDYQPLLKSGGSYVLVGGDTAKLFKVMLFGSWMKTKQQQQFKFFAAKPNAADLAILGDWLATGQLQPCIDRTYPLQELPQAMQALEQRQICGKAVISLDGPV